MFKLNYSSWLAARFPIKLPCLSGELYRFCGTEGYYKNLVSLLRNEIGLIPRGLAPRMINFKDFFIQLVPACRQKPPE
ncbi:MAG: hypothetical protein DRJ15_01465 [Bacteroidetes bacterium]|nr:MAG: hypothetical protein DRJ15_01465 [Bacteroidota bacterium]